MSNTTGLAIMMDTAQLVTKHTAEAVSGIEAALYFIQPSQSDQLLKSFIDEYEFYELLRWPITLGFLTFLLFLCTVLVIGVARSSRCLLIFFSVLGLFTVAICWLLSGLYLATSVAVADFCVAPQQHVCTQQRLQYIFQTNCGASGTNHFVIRLSNSKESIDFAKKSLFTMEDIGRRIFPSQNVIQRVSHIHQVLDNSINTLASKISTRRLLVNYTHYNFDSPRFQISPSCSIVVPFMLITRVHLEVSAMADYSGCL